MLALSLKEKAQPRCPSKLFLLTLTLFLLAQPLQAFAPRIAFQSSRTTLSPRFYATDNVDRSVAKSEPKLVTPNKQVKTAKTIIGKKATVTKIHSLDEFKCYLEEDDRLVAIKFYAPWCKSCQRLGQHFDRLAKEMGDGVLNRQKVQGRIRCARIEYGSETYRFITETLQVRSVPTLQLYRGLNKVWEISGKSTTKALIVELAKLGEMDEDELRAHAEQVDDGILIGAIEDSFFDVPDFLNEEW